MALQRIIEKSLITVSIILNLFLIHGCNNPGKPTEAVAVAAAAPEPKLVYGIAIDSLNVYTGTIKKNQFLSDLLLSYNVDYATIDRLAKISKETFDVRKIRAGNRYSVMCRNDSTEKVQYFVYEISPTNYVVYDLGDSVHVHMGKKDIEVRSKSTSGVITSSLWNAMVDNHTDPNLANELSEIYAWTIDFFGIQKGDSYKVIYDELYVEDEYIGVGNVYAGYFHHANHDYYAFYFVQDSVGDYFDETANSMRRTFLKAPLKYNRISSRFSNSRLHPVLKIRRPHHGVDYAAPVGTPVHAIGEGVVIEAQYRGQNGRIVKIKHNGTYTTAYLHLSKFGNGIKTGVHVSQGQVIGYVGNSGLASGPHLDFRFYKNGQAVDPLKVESPPAEPVEKENLSEFYALADQYKAKLDSIQIKDTAVFADLK
jgi:murein DD-endopeptidase MepM/ murein hydrolase activator NlpD